MFGRKVEAGSLKGFQAVSDTFEHIQNAILHNVSDVYANNNCLIFYSVIPDH